MNQRGFANVVLIGAVFLLVAVGGYFVVTKKPEPAIDLSVSYTDTSDKTTNDETADWKTYIDTKYGFELKYPNDWDVGVNSFLKDTISVAPISGMNENQLNLLFIRIEPSSLDYDSFMDNTMGEKYIKIGTFAGKSAKIFSCSNSDEICRTDGYAYNKIIRFTQLPNGWESENQIELVTSKGYENSYPILETILSTFKFTK